MLVVLSDTARRRRRSVGRFASRGEIRKTRGQLIDRSGGKARIAAAGRESWTGWIDLKKEHIADEAITNTARVIAEVNADILVIAEVRTTGAPVRVVAERLGVTVSSAHLWMKDAGPAPSVPVFREGGAGATGVLGVGSARVRVEAGFDAELLREAIAAVGQVS